MTAAPAIVWFRHDLRLQDNPALEAALAVERAIVPLFIWSPEEEGDWPPGGASRWWLHHSLTAFAAELQRRGSRLVLARGPVLPALRRVVRECGAGAVFWNRRYEPAAIAHDTVTKQALLDDGLDVRSFNGALLHAPTRVQNKSGQPFQVFTPFWKHCQTLPVRAIAASDRPRLPSPKHWPASASLDSFALRPTIPWDREFHVQWKPGEAGAHETLERFLAGPVHTYATVRDQPACVGTSRLSPHLRWGEISPVQVWHAVRGTTAESGGDVFLREIAWREFAHHLLFHFPHTTSVPLRPEFARFPWRKNAAHQRAWQRGVTGYPIVDAGMRELWRTGWMHNRVRMIVASFLVKHLLQPWTAGAAWFWDTLVDADLANNTLGWQWSAGCGADAAPYFRVFNPVLQSHKFDAAGEYVSHYVPELARLAAGQRHAPWAATPETLAAAGVSLGATYPRPIVEHSAARGGALAAYAEMRGGKK